MQDCLAANPFDGGFDETCRPEVERCVRDCGALLVDESLPICDAAVDPSCVFEGRERPSRTYTLSDVP